MAPTTEEELKLHLYSGDLSRLGTAERFLKVLVEIPFAFKRLESLYFMCTLQEEAAIIKEAFTTLEVTLKLLTCICCLNLFLLVGPFLQIVLSQLVWWFCMLESVFYKMEYIERHCRVFNTIPRKYMLILQSTDTILSERISLFSC